jgi:hypothetical protein
MTAIPLLPSNHPFGPNPYNAETHPSWNSAYDQCLQLQTSNPQLAIYARCLGYLLIEAIDDASRDYIAEEIVMCMDNDNSLEDLAKLYVNHIFRLCEFAPCSPILNCLHFSQSARIKERLLRHHITPAAIPLKMTGLSTLLLLTLPQKTTRERKNQSVLFSSIRNDHSSLREGATPRRLPLYGNPRYRQ